MCKQLYEDIKVVACFKYGFLVEDFYKLCFSL